MNRTRIAAIFSALGLLAMTGCDQTGGSLSQISGHYEGTLTTHLDSAFHQLPVAADIQKSPFPLSLTFQEQSGKPALQLEIHEGGSNSITLKSELATENEIVSLQLTQDCYTGKSRTGRGINLCAMNREFSLEVSDASGASVLSLHAFPFPAAKPSPQEESPRGFTLSEAIERARKQSFDSRIEFEHVLQAKALSRAAYLHLLPQITLGTVVNNITPSFQTILGAIGDLAPFLLPNRWLSASQASNQSEAEKDTQKIMQLDMGVNIEGLFYAYARDKATHDLTRAALEKAISVRNEVQVREELGLLAAGATDSMNSSINQIEQSLLTLEMVRAEDLGAISQSLGYFSPKQVLDAVIDHEPAPIQTAPSVNYEALNAMALNRSFELDQLHWLIDSAQKSKGSKYFTWLDPAGDSNLGLGFALGSQIEVSSSQIHELEIEREQLKSILSQKVFNSVTNYQQAVNAFAETKKGIAIQERRMNQALSDLDTGKRVDFFGLVSIFQDHLAAQISLESAQANYRVARAQLERLTLEGYYGQF